MRRLVGAGLLAATVGCGNGGVTGSDNVDLSGLWNYTQTTADAPRTTRCGEGGQIDISQTGVSLAGRISGRGGCEGPTGAFDYVVSGLLSQARVAEGQLVFQAGACRYSGTYTATRAAGNVSCRDTHTAAPIDLQGSWEMTRAF